MQLRGSASAPYGSSCLTCRQRRKKCDRVRPVCERCTKGGFHCLGYDHKYHVLGTTVNSSGGEASVASPLGETSAEVTLTLPQTSIERVALNDVAQPDTSTDTVKVETESISSTSMCLDPLGLYDESGVSILGAGLLYRVAKSRRPVPRPNSEDVLITDSLRIQYDERWPQSQSGSLTRTPSHVAPNTNAPEWPPSPVEVSVVVKDIGTVVKVLQRSIPRSVNANAQMRESYFAYTLTKYQLQRLGNAFRPPPPALTEKLNLRMRRSETSLSFLYLGARIFEALSDKSQGVTIRSCIQWVDKVDSQVTGDPPSNSPMNEVEDRLSGLLELVYVKFVLLGTTAGYLLLERTLPTFLQVVSTEPNLWSEQRGLLRISLPRALNAHRYEVRRFVYYDTMCALALGVPLLVEYDLSGFPIVPEAAPPLEWVHGIPIELLVNIVQVHTWRASHLGVPNQDDWPILELRTQAWKPRMANLRGPNSFESVARLAVQESWRHATLIYIYMGMCGLNSHDPRIQFSVEQIIQLIELVTETSIDIHFSLPCVMAGLAARYEKQRAFVRHKLGSFQGTRVWILRGADFCSVLDHLWHGVAASGGAVTWDDYVNSRCIRLPIL